MVSLYDIARQYWGTVPIESVLYCTPYYWQRYVLYTKCILFTGTDRELYWRTYTIKITSKINGTVPPVGISTYSSIIHSM